MRIITEGLLLHLQQRPIPQDNLLLRLALLALGTAQLSTTSLVTTRQCTRTLSLPLLGFLQMVLRDPFFFISTRACGRRSPHGCWSGRRLAPFLGLRNKSEVGIVPESTEKCKNNQICKPPVRKRTITEVEYS